MSDRTHIEWTDATWNPIVGCTRVSEGCRNCYAEVMAARFNQPGQWGEGLARIVDTPQGKDHRWTGKAPGFRPDALRAPLRWQKPRRIFVCSTSDLFHEEVRDEWIDQIFAVMALTPWHTYQVLTKRPERMRDYFAGLKTTTAWDRITDAAHDIGSSVRGFRGSAGVVARPLPNVWLGTSVEDQTTADARVPPLFDTPAALRWVSYEPALGPVDWTGLRSDGPPFPSRLDALRGLHWPSDRLIDLGVEPTFGPRLGWIVMGGESGPGARPMHPDWGRQTRDQCAAAGVPFLFKQWGAWAPMTEDQAGRNPRSGWVPLSGRSRPPAFELYPKNGAAHVARVGKRAAGRLLDGVLHDAYPEPRP